MKLTKIVSAFIGAGVMMSLTVLADDAPTTIGMARGGANFMLYRSSEPTLAVYQGGRSVGSTGSPSQDILTPVSMAKAGTSFILFRQTQQ